jgi:DNA polymerase sigma
MQDDIADGPGPLEGRNAIKMTLQQSLVEALKQARWIDTDAIKSIPHAPIPIIKLVTRKVMDREMHVDVSFRSANHNGLGTKKLVENLLTKLPALTPLVLVLKQFLAERGLGSGYTGGLSSYGLFLLVACFLEHHLSRSATASSIGTTHGVRSPQQSGKLRKRVRSNSHGPFGLDLTENNLGYLLIRFFKFYGDLQLFDPNRTAVSLVNGFCDRVKSIQGTDGAASRATNASNFNNNSNNPNPASRVTPQTMQRHQRQRLGTSATLNASTSFSSAAFDPICIEDPMLEGNNVGRNCFRFNAIQREWRDAGDILRKAIIEGPRETSLLGLIGVHI